MLEKFTVENVPIEDQILPTVRPLSSVYGDDMSIVDIPRSVSSVNQAWMEERQVKNAMDFGQFSPGVYSPAQYGIPATPQIRGDLAQIYVDGQVTLFTRNEIFPSFNGVEAMDIVKGPGSAVYGPQGEGPGGYVNLVMKQPYFDGEHTEITSTWGSWTSGHSYSNPSVQIDTSAPLSNKLAYRVSYLSQYGDGYYLNTKNETQDVFAALTYLATPTLKFEYWAQDYSSRFNEVAGVNRVTQNFIWTGDYIAGPATSGYAGIFALLNPATAHIVNLPDYVTVESPLDSNRAKRFQTQLVATDEITPDSKLINRTYFENADARQFEGFGYDEFEPLMESLQDRLEYHESFNLGPTSQQIIAGVDERFTRQITYNDYALEPFFYFDLTQPLNQVLIPGYYTYLDQSLGGGYHVPGVQGYSADPYSNGNQDATIMDSALFFQDNVKLNSWLSALVGIRGDSIYAKDLSPSMYVVGTNAYVPNGALYAASDTVVDPSYFASLVFKISDKSSLYLTYDEVDSVLGSANFGGIGESLSFTAADNTPAVYKATLATEMQTRSTLYEAGYKETLLNNTLYGTVAVFQQHKEEPQLFGPADLVIDNGVEIEAVYQPDAHLALNGNLTYQDATEFGSSFYEQTGNYLDGYPVGYIVDGKSGTGVGAINFGGYSPPSGKMRAPGVPQVLANFFAEYKFTDGFAFGLGPRINGRQDANDEGTLHIPGEYELDGFIAYRRKRWDVQVNLTNMTNQRLLDPIDVTFAGNDQIYVRPPISASFTFRVRF